jgi:hypothetical protein
VGGLGFGGVFEADKVLRDPLQVSLFDHALGSGLSIQKFGQ